MIIEKGTGKHIGMCGLQRIDLINRSTEFAIIIGETSKWNLGYGTEAVKKLFEHGFNRLGLNRSQFTTQIEHYDNLAALFDALKRINTIILDLNRDFWTYISMEYFRQKVKAGETGSSAMPHKVNPIDFENAEGNFGFANSILGFLAEKLPVSRLQRDLTDSTVLRNIGMPVAHSLIAIQSVQKGLGKLLLNQQAISNDLNKHAAVVAEAIQTILRREAYPNPYEALKELTRGKDQVNLDDIREFVNQLDVSQEIKQELLAITPSNYTGIISF
jgi:adenylosuccinate lyase